MECTPLKLAEDAQVAASRSYIAMSDVYSGLKWVREELAQTKSLLDTALSNEKAPAGTPVGLCVHKSSEAIGRAIIAIDKLTVG